MLVRYSQVRMETKRNAMEAICEQNGGLGHKPRHKQLGEREHHPRRSLDYLSNRIKEGCWFLVSQRLVRSMGSVLEVSESVGDGLGESFFEPA